MKNIFIYLMLIWSFSVKAQNNNSIILELGTEFPLNYSVGIGAMVHDNFQLNLRAGLLTKPYDFIILKTLEAFGVKESYTNTIGDAFSHGKILKVGVNYYFSGFYTGAFYSFVQLNAKDVPTDLLNNFYGINLPVSSFYDFIEYQLRSNLHNFGLLIGKSFPLNDKFSIGGEFSLAKTVASKNSISSNYDKEMVLATGIIHKELEPLYKKYSYLPSLNIFIRFNL